MKREKVFLLILVLAAGLVPCSLKAQNIALRTNLFYGAYTLTPNLGVEFGLGSRSTMDIGGGYNPWNLEGEGTGGNKKLEL